MRRIHAPLVLISLMIGCAAPPAREEPPAAAPDPAAVRAAIEATNARFMATVSSGDSANMYNAVMDQYEDGTILMFPGAPMLTGKSAIGPWLSGALGSMKFSDASSVTTDVIVAGDYAVETGSYKWTITPRGGKPMPDTGKYMTVWHKQADGTWKIIRDINNSDIAPK